MDKPSKYKAKKTEIDGIKFDSTVEGEYYSFLKKLKDDGIILKLELQPQFTIQDGFNHKKHGIIQPIKYKADFRITLSDWDVRIIDVKGVATPDALLKRKMFLKEYPFEKLHWISKSIKYGDLNGWIDYFKLRKIRRKNKRKS